MSEAPGGSETEDNDHSRISLECSLVFEQETEQGQVATDVTAQTPGEADCLLVSRGPLVEWGCRQGERSEPSGFLA